MTDKIAIIGFGNIASAIVTPLLDNKLIQPENVFCVVKTEKSYQLRHAGPATERPDR